MRDDILAAKVLRLERQVQDMRVQLPVRIGVNRPPMSIIIIGGQTMGTSNGITYYGIEKFAGTLSSVASASYDPGTVNSTTGAQTAGPTPAITAWPSGLGFGTACINGSYKRVMVVNDSRGGCANALVGGADDDTTYVPSLRQTTILSTRLLTVTISGGTTISAYSPDLG